MNDVSGSGPVPREYAVTGGQQIQLPARELPKMKRAAYDEGYGHGFEAGVQAERERFERQFMESLLTRRAAPSWILGREPSKPLNEDNLTVEQGFWLDVRAALAVVTGKEGASDE